MTLLVVHFMDSKSCAIAMFFNVILQEMDSCNILKWHRHIIKR